MVRAEVARQGLVARRVIEHPAQRRTVHGTAVHAKADDAPRPVIHHDEHLSGSAAWPIHSETDPDSRGCPSRARGS